MSDETRDYSKCCGSPILHDRTRRRLYCDGCYKTIPGFGPRARDALRSELLFQNDWARVDLIFRDRRIAYVRDTPDFTWSNSTNTYIRHAGGFKWFVQGCVYAGYLGLTQCDGQDGFSTKRAALRAFRRMLTEKLGPLDVTRIPIARRRELATD